MQLKITLLAFGALMALSGQADAGVTLVNPKAAKKKKAGITVSVSAGSKSKASARQADEVLFSVKNADLRNVVLPIFERQVGVRIRFVGVSKNLTLRLTQPLHWEAALELVCQFTKTHTTADSKGNMILKGKWAGRVDENVEFDDLNGQVKTPHRFSRSAKASVKRLHPVTTQPKLGSFKLGGRGRVGPRNRPYKPQRYRVARRPNTQKVQRYRPQKYKVATKVQRYKPQKYRVKTTRVRNKPQKYRPTKYRPAKYKVPKYKVKRYKPNR